MRLRPSFMALAPVLVVLAACSDTVTPSEATHRLSPNAPSAVILTDDSKYVCCGLGVTGIVLSPTSVSLAPAATANVTATLKTNYGWTLDPAEKGRLVVWESADPTIAKVVSTGRASASITAVRGGTTTITAYVQSVSTKIPVTVTGTQTAPVPTQPTTPVVSSVVVTPGTASAVVGATVQLTATPRDASGAPIAVSSPGTLATTSSITVAWTSSDSTIARVSSAGLVTALKAGSATITATAGGKSAGATVTVTAPVVVTPTPAPAPTPTIRRGYYVAPTGARSGRGTVESPWDLATALDPAFAPGVVQPGDTIWVRGGTYRGQFYSRIAGTGSAPIVVRQYPGERATIDGNLVILGPSTVYWGLEVMSSNASRPAVVGVDVKGANTRLVNMVVHDAGDSGFGFWVEALNAEIYGSIIYNNGRMLSGRGAAHGIYAQNRDGTKRIVDNILFNQFSYGIHVYGSDVASMRGFQIEGNASFNNGTSAVGGTAPDLYVGGGTAASAITIANNYTYRADQGTTAAFGSLWGPTNGDLALTNNTLVGTTSITSWASLRITGNTFTGVQTVMMLRLPAGLSASSYTWDQNRYFPSAGMWAPFNVTQNGGTIGYDLAGWQRATGKDLSSTLTRGRPTGVQVYVRPNRYERGRANVIVYNWDRTASVSVDASAFLSAGTRYEVRSAQHFYGAPVASGTYYGGAITIPITAIQPPTPIGGPVAPPSTGVDFNAYVVVPVGQ